MKRVRWRRRWMGPKHGIARGTAVFTSRATGGVELPREFHVPYEQLRDWSSTHGVDLDETPESLARLDQHLDGWNADPTHHDEVDLSNEVGAYLGAVFIAHCTGARWRAWPNGHPVIELASGKVCDVTQMVSDRLRRPGRSLDALYRSAQTP